MDGKAAYEKIAGHYRMLILNGQLREGVQLPTFMELAETWSVTRVTAGRAIEQLRNEGLVSTAGRHGTRVSGVREGGEATVVIALGSRGLRVEETRVIDVMPHVAVELGVEPGSSVLVVRLAAYRILDDEDDPVSVG